MPRTYHQDIFYPSKPEIGDLPAPTCSLKTLPAFIALPHASWDYILDQLKLGFSAVSSLKPSKVFILGPVHKGPIDSESKEFAFTQTSGPVEGATWSVSIASCNEPFIAENNSYFSEEPCCELLYPIISKVFPSAEVIPILASKNGKELKHFIQDMVKKYPDSLFIVSSNCNREFSGPLGEQQADRFLEMLEKGETACMAKDFENGVISACSYMWFAAIGGKWILLASDKSKVRHASLIRKEDVL